MGNNNVEIDAARDLGLTAIKKYWGLAGQIEKKVNGLYRDSISALAAFMTYSRKTNNNEEVTENMKIRRNIDSEWASLLFVQLYGFIYCWKIDEKDIADAAKLVNKLLRCSLVWGTDRRLCQDHIWIGGGESIHEPTNESKPWNGK